MQTVPFFIDGNLSISAATSIWSYLSNGLKDFGFQAAFLGDRVTRATRSQAIQIISYITQQIYTFVPQLKHKTLYKLKRNHRDPATSFCLLLFWCITKWQRGKKISGLVHCQRFRQITDPQVLNWRPRGNICQFHGFGHLGRVDTNIVYKLAAASISWL